MRIVLTIAFTATLVVAPLVAKADEIDLDGDVYRNESFGLQASVPEGWLLSRMTGYRSMLALLIHRDGAQISLSIDHFAKKQSMIQLLLQTKRALAAVGIDISGSKLSVKIGDKTLALLDGRRIGKRWRLRQAYFPRGRRIVIVTYGGPEASFDSHIGDFEYLLESLRASREEWPDEEALGDKGRRAPKAGSTAAGQRPAAPALENVPELGGKPAGERARSGRRSQPDVESQARSGRPATVDPDTRPLSARTGPRPLTTPSSQSASNGPRTASQPSSQPAAVAPADRRQGKAATKPTRPAK